MDALSEMSDAAAHATLVYAMTNAAVPGRVADRLTAGGNQAEWRGTHRQR